MKNQIKFKIDSIKLDIYKNNIVTLIQFNSNSTDQIEIMTVSEIVDMVIIVSGNYRGTVILALPVKIDCNHLDELVIKLKKSGYKIIIKSEFQPRLLQYVFNAKLQAELNVQNVNSVISDFCNLSDKITFSFLITSKTNFDSTINFIKLIRPHTKAGFNLYTNDNINAGFNYLNLYYNALDYPNIMQLNININK